MVKKLLMTHLAPFEEIGDKVKQLFLIAETWSQKAHQQLQETIQTHTHLKFYFTAVSLWEEKGEENVKNETGEPPTHHPLFQQSCLTSYGLTCAFCVKYFAIHLQDSVYFYRTRVRSLGMLVTNSLTDSLTHSVTFSKLD